MADIAADDGVSRPAIYTGVKHSVARTKRVAAAFGDKEAFAAMSVGTPRDRARSAVEFIEQRLPAHRRARDARKIAESAAQTEAFESEMADFERMVKDELDLAADEHASEQAG